MVITLFIPSHTYLYHSDGYTNSTCLFQLSDTLNIECQDEKYPGDYVGVSIKYAEVCVCVRVCIFSWEEDS